jgi:arginyl-tRNA synthetase
MKSDKEKLRELIDSALAKYVAELGCPGLTVEYDIWVPKNRDHGDYSSNVALKLHAKLKRMVEDFKAQGLISEEPAKNSSKRA